MKILILTLGTQGDVQPYVALAKGLQSNAHTVSICTSEHFKNFIETHNIHYQYMNNSFIELINHPCSKALLDSKSGIFTKIRSGLKLSSLSKKLMKGIFIDTWQAAQNSQPDLIIAHPKMLSASHICEKLTIPMVIASPIPTFEATSEFPLVGLPQLSLFSLSQKKWYNRVSYKLTNKVHHMFDQAINLFRKEQLNLGPCNPKSSPCYTHNNVPVIHLHAHSPEVLPKPQDWRNQAYVTGYWFLDEAISDPIPKKLQEFLAAGEAPIYIGFGSMAGSHAEALGALIVEALKKVKCRAIIAKGWGGIAIDDNDTNENMCIINSVSHNWLFPQVRAIVHHGGAGSTAAALKAGKPMLICPFGMDQPFWGKRITALNLGVNTIHQRKLTVNNLANALNELIHNEFIAENAIMIGAKISRENGVQNAIDIIEQAFSES